MTQYPSVYHYISVLLATLLWGVNIVSLKLLVTSFTPIMMTSFRIVTAGIFLMAILFLLKQNKYLTRREWYYVIMGGALGVFAHHLFLSIGLTTLHASTSVLILGLVPVVTAICSHLFFKEAFSSWKIVGICLAFIGVLFVQGGILQMSAGVVFLLIAVIVQAVSFLFIRKASETLSSIQITGYSLMIGALLLFIVSLSVERDGLATFTSGTPAIYGIFLFSALGSTACGQLLFNVSIRHVGASKSALFLNFVPFFGLVCSSFFLGETIYWYHWCGFIFIVCGVLFGTGYVERTWGKRINRSVS